MLLIMIILLGCVSTEEKARNDYRKCVRYCSSYAFNTRCEIQTPGTTITFSRGGKAKITGDEESTEERCRKKSVACKFDCQKRYRNSLSKTSSSNEDLQNK